MPISCDSGAARSTMEQPLCSGQESSSRGRSNEVRLLAGRPDQAEVDRAAARGTIKDIEPAKMEPRLLQHMFSAVSFRTDTLKRIRELANATGDAADDVISTSENNTVFRRRHMGPILDEDGLLSDEIIDCALSFVQRCPGLPGDDASGPSGHRWRARIIISAFATKIMDGSASNSAGWLDKMGISLGDLPKMDCIIIPYGGQKHWQLILVFPLQRRITVLDSLNPGGSIKLGPTYIFTKVKEWAGSVYHGQGQWTQWVLQCPRQHNHSDCGIHVILNAFFVSKGIFPMAHRDITPRQRRYLVAYMASYAGKARAITVDQTRGSPGYMNSKED